MTYTLQGRLVSAFASVLLLASCDSGSTSSSLSIQSSQTSLTAPTLVARAVDTSVLFAQLTLTYEQNSQTVTTPVVIARDPATNTWDTALDIPAYTDFTLDITWFDTQDVERLDLARLSRSFRTLAPGRSTTLTFNFDEYDDDLFNADADAFTNLEERINGTSPFFNDSNSQPLFDDPNVAIGITQNNTRTLTALTSALTSAPLTSSVWSLADDNPVNNSACAAITGFEEQTAAASLADACATADNCDIVFSQPDPALPTGDTTEFTITVPPLKSSIGLDYELDLTNSAQQAINERYTFCLVSNNTAPVAGNDTFTVIAGVPLEITGDTGVNLLSNDRDDNDTGNAPLVVDTTPVTLPALATSFELRADGGFSYFYDPQGANTPTLTDTFEYSVSDGTFTSIATVTLQIVTRDEPPVQTSDIPAQTAIVGIASSIALTAYFNDPEQSELSYAAGAGSLPPSGGLSVINSGTLEGTAQAGDEGTYSVQIVASDQTSSATGILALEVRENQPPMASPIPDVGELASGSAVSVDAAQSFTDPEGVALNFTLQSNPESGLQVNQSTGLVTGQIATAGTYTITVFASDGVTQPVSSEFSVIQLPTSTPGTPILSEPSPTSLSLAANLGQRATGSFSFGNLGDAALEFTVTSDQPWLTVSTGSGVFNDIETGSVTVTGVCETTIETRNATISIGGNGGSESVAVSLECNATESDPLDDVASVEVGGIQGAYFVGTPPQDTNSLALDPIAFDSAVIRGGSIVIPVSAQSAFSTVYIVANNTQETPAGYWQVLLPQPVLEASILINYKPDIPEDSDQRVAVQVGDDNGSVSNISEVILQTESVGTGELQVSVSWDKKSDVDIILLEPLPNGGTYQVSYGRDPSAAGGTLDLDSNRVCVIDGIQNENITYKNANNETVLPPNGEYQLYVLYYDDCDVGSTDYVVTVRNGGNVSTYTGTLTTDREVQLIDSIQVNNPENDSL